MIKFNLDKEQRKQLTKIFLNLCQADFIALVIGRIATPEKITKAAFLLGILIFVVFLLFGILLSKEE
ncbi:MAG: hypothetical protein AB1349_05455 [Elusimicrobiota bacterium]